MKRFDWMTLEETVAFWVINFLDDEGLLLNDHEDRRSYADLAGEFVAEWNSNPLRHQIPGIDDEATSVT